jgi:hypothetical protein
LLHYDSRWLFLVLSFLSQAFELWGVTEYIQFCEFLCWSALILLLGY